MSTMRKLIESLDNIDKVNEQQADTGSVNPAKEKAFKDLGLDEHQWDVFELVYDYCKRQFSPEMQARKRASQAATRTKPYKDI